MAKKRYKVKKGDSFASLGNPEDLMQLNPGVPYLSPGQTIWTPTSPPASTFTVPISVPRSQTTAPNFTSANSFMSGGMLNTGSTGFGGINPAYANQPEFASPGGVNAPRPVPVTGGANSFQSGNMVNNQAALQMALTGTVAPSGGGNTPAPTSVTLPPNYVYSGGNDPLAQEQRRLWNIAAGGTGEERVFLMSREQKHAIGDAKRRRRGRSAAQQEQYDAALASSVQAVVQEQAPLSQGNMVNSALSWRVG